MEMSGTFRIHRRYLNEGQKNGTNRHQDLQGLDRRGRSCEFKEPHYRQAPLAEGWYNRKSLRLVRPK
jgi:hypothetical protein